MRTVNIQIVSLLVAALAFLSCDDLFNTQSGGSGTTSLTSAQIVDGLRGALEVGIDTAATDLSQRGGYLLNELITIALPEDVTRALSYNAMAAFYDIAKTVMNSLPALPFDTLPGDLAGYTTARALDGLFWAVGEEESKIRRNPLARVTQILQDVFGWLDQNNS